MAQIGRIMGNSEIIHLAGKSRFRSKREATVSNFLNWARPTPPFALCSHQKIPYLNRALLHLFIGKEHSVSCWGFLAEHYV